MRCRSEGRSSSAGRVFKNNRDGGFLRACRRPCPRRYRLRSPRRRPWHRRFRGLWRPRLLLCQTLSRRRLKRDGPGARISTFLGMRGRDNGLSGPASALDGGWGIAAVGWAGLRGMGWPRNACIGRGPRRLGTWELDRCPPWKANWTAALFPRRSSFQWMREFVLTPLVPSAALAKPER
jgi:hypothetical protein